MLGHLLTAIGLVLVLEGILPFLNPQSWRKMILLFASKPDTLLRRLGLIAMILGLLLIYLVHHFIIY